MTNIQTVTLNDLVGIHLLSGVDMEPTLRVGYEYAQVINFVLDGVTYTATEDPNDGHRSMLEDIAITDYVVKNTFAPTPVVGKMRDSLGDDVLDLIAMNGKTVLSVGTDNTDHYYPLFRGEWNPENLPQNEGREARVTESE